MSEQAAFWNERYRGEAFAFGTTPNAFLASQVHLLRPGVRALAPGDGEGRNGVWLAEQGLIVDTIDISPLGVAKARALAAERGVTVNAQLADLREWSWPRATYDLAASLFVHFFDADRPRMHRALLESLKPGGILILEAFSLGQIELKKLHRSGGPPTADLLYSNEKLSADFASGSILHLEEIETELDEGRRHKGRAAVVRAIVKRP